MGKAINAAFKKKSILERLQKRVQDQRFSPMIRIGTILNDIDLDMELGYILKCSKQRHYQN